LDASADILQFQDNAKAVFGNGQDLEIYHNASHSFIRSKTGDLNIATSDSGRAVYIGHTTSEVTVMDNLTVTGNLAVTGNFPSGHVLGHALLQHQETYSQSANASSGVTIVTIDTEVYDIGGIVSISSNQFTLTTGTYIINAEIPHRDNSTGRNALRIWNDTDSNYESGCLGISSYFSNGIQTIMGGRIVVSGTKAFELQRYREQASGGDSAGVEHGQSSIGNNVFSSLYIQKVVA
jgi:hypothetical protein